MWISSFFLSFISWVTAVIKKTKKKQAKNPCIFYFTVIATPPTINWMWFFWFADFFLTEKVFNSRDTTSYCITSKMTIFQYAEMYNKFSQIGLISRQLVVSKLLYLLQVKSLKLTENLAINGSVMSLYTGNNQGHYVLPFISTFHSFNPISRSFGKVL